MPTETENSHGFNLQRVKNYVWTKVGFGGFNEGSCELVCGRMHGGGARGPFVSNGVPGWMQ